MVTTLGIDKWMSVNFTHCLGLVKVKMVSIVAALITASRVLFEGGGGICPSGLFLSLLEHWKF